ncbi:MAG: hypothetical protein DRJ18_00220 [Candidatus Methanomethylicota archaeon]|nr:MAG: hypothetical protein DRJ18_00220 [Candidatus Verstraetearchaeota archaeon]
MESKPLFIAFIMLMFLAFTQFNQPSKASTITTTKTFTSLNYDGMIYAEASGYTTARDADSGEVIDGGILIAVGQEYDGNYSIYRAFLIFDTANIPDNANITQAIISIHVSLDHSDTDFEIIVQNGQPTYPHIPLQAGDYDRQHYIGNGGSNDTANIGGSGNWLNITLNSDGKSWINKQGNTKLCLRSSRDINGLAPSGSELIYLGASESAGENAPKLIVSYEYEACIYNFYGPYSEETGLKDGSINVTVYPASGAPFNFTLDGNYTLEVENRPLAIKWRVGENCTRSYVPIYDYEDIYIFKPASPYFYYVCEIIDFIGLHDVYLESKVNLNGSSFIVERRHITSGGKANFVFTEFQTYSFTLKSNEGIIELGSRTIPERPSIFSETIKFMVEPTLLSQDYADYSGLTVSATRINSTSIQAIYQDSNGRTSSVTITIYLIQSNNNLKQEYQQTYSSVNSITLNWYDALPEKDYLVEFNVEHADYGSLTWKIPCPAPPSQSTASIWNNLLGWLGDWPINPSNFISAVLIICMVTLGSYKDAHIGLFAGAITAGILIWLGWYSMSWGTLSIIMCLIGMFAMVKGRRRLIER